MQRSLKFVLIIAVLAFSCVALIVAMQGIHPAPAAPMLREDRAELARLEKEAQPTPTQSVAQAAPSPAIASSQPTSSVGEPPREELQPKPSPAKPLASHTRASRAAEQSKAWRRYQEALQRQRALAADPQRYAQQESTSFFTSIARALGLSGR